LVCGGIDVDGPSWKNINHERVEPDKLKEGETETGEAKKGVWNSFFDSFLERKVVFASRPGCISSTEDAPEPIDIRLRLRIGIC
jgi:hypothetical protein